MINAVGNPQTVLLFGGTSEIGLAICAEYLKKGPARIILAALPDDPGRDDARRAPAGDGWAGDAPAEVFPETAGGRDGAAQFRQPGNGPDGNGYAGNGQAGSGYAGSGQAGNGYGGTGPAGNGQRADAIPAAEDGWSSWWTRSAPAIRNELLPRMESPTQPPREPTATVPDPVPAPSTAGSDPDPCTRSPTTIDGR